MTLTDYVTGLTQAVTDEWLTEADKSALLAAAARDGVPVIVSTTTETRNPGSEEEETVTVLDFSDIKQHLNIIGSHDDAILLRLVIAAQTKAVTHIGFSLDDADEFPNGCPESIKQAIRMLVAAMHQNREGSLGVIDDVYGLLQPYKKWVFA